MASYVETWAGVAIDDIQTVNNVPNQPNVKEVHVLVAESTSLESIPIRTIHDKGVLWELSAIVKPTEHMNLIIRDHKGNILRRELTHIGRSFFDLDEEEMEQIDFLTIRDEKWAHQGSYRLKVKYNPKKPPCPNLFWLEPPGRGVAQTRVQVSHRNQVMQCWHCLKVGGRCPSGGRGYICRNSGTNRTHIGEYMRGLFTETGYKTKKESYEEEKAKERAVAMQEEAEPDATSASLTAAREESEQSQTELQAELVQSRLQLEEARGPREGWRTRRVAAGPSGAVPVARGAAGRGEESPRLHQQRPLIPARDTRLARGDDCAPTPALSSRLQRPCT